MTTVQDTLNAMKEAASAFEREPQHLRHIENLERDLDQSQRHAQELEMKCGEYRDHIDQLQSRVRSLEVERDDASFRLLEAEDKLDGLKGRVADLRHNLNVEIRDIDKMLADVTPPAPMPEPTLDEMKSAVQGTQSEPFTAPSPEATPVPITESGQSEPRPTVFSTEGQSPSASSVETLESVSSTSKPYEGKRWSDVFPRVYGIDLWLDGGGTRDNYNL